jgi:hypothetical protein
MSSAKSRTQKKVVAHAQEDPCSHRRRPAAHPRRGRHVGRLGGGAERFPAARLAQAAANAAAAEAKHVTRLVVIVSVVDAREFDAPPVGGELSTGDTVLLTEDVFTPAGRRIGHNEVRFTVMLRGEAFGEGSFILPGRGQILVEGVIDLANPRGEFAVVGGTREFRNARGQVFQLPGPTPEQTKLVFALLL